MDTTQIDRWLAGYLEAWRSDALPAIEALFAEDCEYYTAPYRPAMTRDRLIEYWVDEQESQIPWSCQHEVLAREGALHVVRAVVRYPAGEDGASEPVVYHNVWLITLGDDGRARRFVEHFMAEE
jgi:hypothetical protein